jgi:hypothetical protein
MSAGTTSNGTKGGQKNVEWQNTAKRKNVEWETYDERT